MTVRANGNCIRHRIRSAVRQLAEVMNFEKRTICPQNGAGWSQASQLSFARLSTHALTLRSRTELVVVDVAVSGALLPSGRSSSVSRSSAMVAVDQKRATPTASSTGNDPVAKAAPATPTNMDLATEIYKRMRTVKDVARKDIIEKFIAEVKLTKAGASTYYQLIKDKHEPMGKK